ncbi:31619_t:CDS:1, partial [Gigaspora margarita]
KKLKSLLQYYFKVINLATRSQDIFDLVINIIIDYNKCDWLIITYYKIINYLMSCD